MSTGNSSEKIKPFDTNLEATTSNLSNCRLILKFDNSFLVQKNSCWFYSNIILNSFIVYELRNWSRNPTINLPLKSFSLVEPNYNGQGIAFDGEDGCRFGNDFARNVVIFGVDNSSSSTTNNRKNSTDVILTLMIALVRKKKI